MSVEIREIAISMTLLGDEPERRDENGPQDGAGLSPVLSEDERRALVDECVDSVLRVLKDKREP